MSLYSVEWDDDIKVGLKKQSTKTWNGYGPEADSFEFRNELSDSINSAHFLGYKSDYQLLKKVSVRSS
jgi:hypothetical protein